MRTAGCVNALLTFPPSSLSRFATHEMEEVNVGGAVDSGKKVARLNILVTAVSGGIFLILIGGLLLALHLTRVSAAPSNTTTTTTSLYSLRALSSL